MKRLETFTRSNGDRIGLATFYIRRLHPTMQPNVCSVVFYAPSGGRWTENTLDVLGTFDDLASQLEDLKVFRQTNDVQIALRPNDVNGVSTTDDPAVSIIKYDKDKHDTCIEVACTVRGTFDAVLASLQY